MKKLYCLLTGLFLFIPTIAWGEVTYITDFSVDIAPQEVYSSAPSSAASAYSKYMSDYFCGENSSGLVSTINYGDKITIKCSEGWATQPNDDTIKEQHNIALCHAACVNNDQVYSSGSIATKCICDSSTTQKPANNKTSAPEQTSDSDASKTAEPSATDTTGDSDSDTIDEKAQKKKKECASRNPPMDIEKNFLGMWVCVDTKATKEAKEKERAENETLDEYWTKLEKLEDAFNKRLRQLNRETEKILGDK